MKKIFIFTLTLLTVASLAVGICANRTLPLVVDNADLLTSLEETALTATLDDISSRHQIEIAIVTVNSTSGKSAMDYADDFYDDNGYGFGEDDDGVLLLIDMGGREWWITTHGRGAYYLNDYYLYEIENAFIDDLSAGNYVDAFYTFANMCQSYIISAKYEETNDAADDYFTDAAVTTYTEDDYYYDYDEYDEGGFSFTYIVPAVIVGFIISLIMVSVMKSGMKTVRPASGATDYMVNGSLSLRSQSDRYLYSNTVRTRRDTSSHSSGHGGSRGGFSGGSSMHRSSSGRSHGGRGGRF